MSNQIKIIASRSIDGKRASHKRPNHKDSAPFALYQIEREEHFVLLCRKYTLLRNAVILRMTNMSFFNSLRENLFNLFNLFGSYLGTFSW